MSERVRGSSGAVFGAAKGLVDARARHRIPERLRDRWTTASTEPSEARSQAASTFVDRLRRDREVIVPWLAEQRDLLGARVLEVGCGPATCCPRARGPVR